MIRNFIGLCVLIGLTACVSGRPDTEYYTRAPGQGQYQRPTYLNPTPLAPIQSVDTCRSKFYQGLLGQHEGSIYFSALPGIKRVIKPAELEIEDDGYLAGTAPPPPLIEVRDYLSDQVIYAPSVRYYSDISEAGLTDESRLTIELDREGYVADVRCG